MEVWRKDFYAFTQTRFPECIFQLHNYSSAFFVLIFSSTHNSEFSFLNYFSPILYQSNLFDLERSFVFQGNFIFSHCFLIHWFANADDGISFSRHLIIFARSKYSLQKNDILAKISSNYIWVRTNYERIFQHWIQRKFVFHDSVFWR